MTVNCLGIAEYSYDYSALLSINAIIPKKKNLNSLCSPRAGYMGMIATGRSMKIFTSRFQSESNHLEQIA